MNQEQKDFFELRLNPLGVNDENNRIKVLRSVGPGDNKLLDLPLFVPCEKGIKIYVLTLDRLRIPFAKEGSKWKDDDYHIIRLREPKVKPNGDVMKYEMPKGQGTHPFIPNSLIEKFEKKEHIENLYFTEGFFKAWKGCNEGLDVVGFSSITHMREKDSGAIYSDVKRLIKACTVKRLIWLQDGDCLNITPNEIKDGTDLYKRPKDFFQSAHTFQQLLSDFDDCEKWFAHINSEELENKPKGLDDLFCQFPEQTPEIISEFNSFSKQHGRYVYKLDITYSSGKLARYFNLDDVNKFYLHHVEKRPEIKGKEFIWNGTLYKYDDEKSECKIMVPGEAKNYFRVGDQYHEFVSIPNKYGELEQTFHRRQKTTIIDDHGKELVKHVPRYKAFCNVPDHLNYQQVIYNNFNIYAKFEHEPAEEECNETDCESIIKFLKHIFGHGTIEYKNPDTKLSYQYNELDLGLDYLQLLYTRPANILPILCLVSKENETGKSTFAKLLKMIFTSNAAIVGNAELADNFNASWASKLIIICDEAKIDKQTVVEKVKSLSTADKIFMNAKGKDHTEIDFFGKFLFLTNNEENFIYASEDDRRYWVRKVPVIKELNNNLLTDMKEQIPAFLSFLNKRKMITENRTRMWFDPALLKTDALKRVIQYSQPTIEKELRQFIRDKFFDFGIEELTMTKQAIQQDCFKKRYEDNYLLDVLKDRIKVDLYHEYEFDGKTFPSLEAAQKHAIDTQGSADIATLQAIKVYKQKRHNYPRWEEKKIEGGGAHRERVDIKDNGRPYIFKRENFLTAAEIANYRPDSEQVYQNKVMADNQPVPVPDDTLPF